MFEEKVPVFEGVPFEEVCCRVEVHFLSSMGTSSYEQSRKERAKK